MTRLRSLDILRGVGILVVVFLHSAVYQYEYLADIDFANPPLVVTILGLLLMFAGYFLLLSGLSNAISVFSKIKDGTITVFHARKKLIVQGLLMLAVHFVYFIFLAPTLLDLEGGNHKYAVIPGLIAKGELLLPHMDRIVYNTVLSCIAYSLIAFGLLMPLLVKIKDRFSNLGAGVFLFILAAILIAMGPLRIELYPLYQSLNQEGSGAVAFVLGLFVNKNDPIIPYVGFGLFGVFMGYQMVFGFQKHTRKLFALFGLLWLTAGVLGYVLAPDTMLERDIDWIWYAVVLLQLGISILLIVWFMLMDSRGSRETTVANTFSRLIETCGKMSLTIFVLETPLTYAFVLVLNALYPVWNDTMGSSIVFGLLNAFMWVVIAQFWYLRGARFSAEWLWVKTLNIFKVSSCKNQRT